MTAITRVLGGVAAVVISLSLVACAGKGYPPSVVEGSQVDVAWGDSLSSVNVASTAGATGGNFEVEQLTRSQFVRERAGKIEPNPTFGSITIEEEAEDSFTLGYDLEQPVWSDGIALDAADLLLAWAAGSNFFAPDSEAPEDELRFDSVPTGMALSDEIPTYDEFERRIDVHFARPFNGWESALDVAVPAHVVGRYALGIDDPMAAKTAVVEAITGSDTAALAKIAALWNSGFALGEDQISRDDLMLSSGPYRVETVEGASDDPAQRVTLVVNSAYVAEKTASYERIVLQHDDGENLSDAVGTEYDLGQVVPRADNFESIRQLERDDYGVDDIDHGVVWVAQANTAASRPLSDSAVRGVLMRSFDRGDVAAAGAGPWSDIYSGVSSVVFAPGTDGYQVAVEDAGFTAKFRSGGDAADLRIAAGVPEGIRICVLYDRGSALAAGMFASFQAQVGEGGWIATDCGSDMPEEVAASSDDWDIYLGTMEFPVTADELRAQWGTGGAWNYSDANDAARDDLLAQLEVETDQYRARDLRVAIERTVVDQMVIAPLTIDPILVISDRDVEGVEPRSSRHRTLLDRAIGWRPYDAEQSNQDEQPTPPADEGDDSGLF
ncbi:hypothetical protein [Microbacterium sp.]|uniref:hypothetical protein n=1 Tax=Microbacterium sp. TaxID=51671 RepID=UPI003A8F69FB